MSENTPRVGLRWKKDSKLSRDLVCFQSGKALNPDGTKNKYKEPDITVAIFRAQKEITLYEPNMNRVDIEDVKGLEVVLLLGALVIRDVYFGEMKEVFNLDSRKASYNATSSSAPHMTAQAPISPLGSPGAPARDARIPPTDPRSQWELDAETARLRKQFEEEEQERKRREEAEDRRVRQMLEAEERAAREKQAQVDAETERLKRIYGGEPAPPGHPSRRHSSDPRQSMPPPLPAQHHYPTPTAWGSYNAGPYMSGANAQSGFLSPAPQNQRLKNKSSIFSFGRRRSDEDENKLTKKRSAVF